MKRIFSFFIAMCLMAVCLPVNIMAYDDNEFSISDYTITENADNTMTVESITVQAANTENVTLYTAVYNDRGVLRKIVSMKIENAGVNVLKPNLTLDSGAKAKAFLWRNMEPLTEVCVLEHKTDKPTPTVSPTASPTAVPTATPTAPPVTEITEMYVAVNGNDETGDGTIDNPYASFEKAQSVVRTMNKNMRGDITVYFRGGTYYPAETITLGTEDSGSNGYNVQYKAYQGEIPVFSGGQKVTGWEKDTEYPNLYSAPLTRDKKLRQLFVNDQRAYMPSKAIQGQGGYGTYEIKAGEGNYAWEDLSKSDGVKFNAADLPANIKNPSDIEVQTRTTWQAQTIAIRDVQSIDGYTVALFEQPYGAMAQNLSWNTAYSPSKRNYVYNVFEFLDEPGEFYFDKANQKLYYMPRDGEDMSNADVYAPEIETLLKISGDNLTSHASHIVIDGLTFENSDWNLYEVAGSHGKTSTQASLSLTATAGNWHYSAYRNVDTTPAVVEVQSADNINFVNNTVQHTANDGLNILNDVTESVFDGNRILDTGATGMSIGHPQHHFIGDKNSDELTGYKDPSNQHSDMEKYDVGVEGLCKTLKITNNYLTDLGNIFYGCPGITLYYGTDLKILHNHIEDAPYSGISIGWGWGYMRGADKSDTGGSTSEVGETPNLKNNEIAYNRVIHTLTELSDGGAIYTLGPMKGSSVHDNYISEVGTNGYHNRGIHLDEGTRYLNLYNNVINVGTAQAGIDAGTWGSNSNVYHRKGYNTISGNYTTTELYTTTNSYETGTEITDKHINISGFWNEQSAIDIIRNSGVSDKYLGREYTNPANIVLPANYSLPLETGITEIDVPQTIDGDIWLAPEGTTEFAESDTIKKAANGKLAIPTEKGEYYVYIVNDGTVIGVSDKYITTYEVKVVTEVEPRDDVIGPFWTDEEEENHVNKTQGTGGNVENTNFGVSVAVSDDSAVFGITKLSMPISHKRINGIDNGSGAKWDGYVDKTVTMDRAGNYDVYILCFGASGRSYNVFVDSELAATTKGINTEDTTVYTSANGLNILKETIWLNEGENTIKIQGNGAAPNFVAFALTKAEPTIPSDGLQLWLSADKGVQTNGDIVTKWVDISGAEHDAVPDDENSAPSYVFDNATGKMSVSFDGENDKLKFPFTGLIADKSDVTVIIVSATDTENPSTNTNGDNKPLLYFNESGSWGKFVVTPFKDIISMRLPGRGHNYKVNKASQDIHGGFSTAAIVKSGTTIEVYDKDSNSIANLTDVQGAIENTSDEYGYLGGYSSNVGYFSGNVAEVIIYNRAVDLGVIQAINTYLSEKYYTNEPQDIELTGKLDISNGTQNEGVTTPGVAAKNKYIENIFGEGGYSSGKYVFGGSNDYKAAFDGDVSNFYDGPKSGYCGVEFKEAQIVTKIGYKVQASNRVQRLNGAVLQGSNDGESYTDIMTISGAETSMKYAQTECTTPYKFIRLKRPDTEVLNIVELELYTTINAN